MGVMHCGLTIHVGFFLETQNHLTRGLAVVFFAVKLYQYTAMPALGSTVFLEAIVFCTYGFNLKPSLSSQWSPYETSFASVLFDFTLRVR